MAAAAQKGRLAERSDNLRNIVREYRDLLDEAFGNERRSDLTNEFEKFAADPAVEVIEKITSMRSVEDTKKYAAIKIIFDTAAKAMEELAKPALSTAMWSDRGKENRYANPCEFVQKNYPSYGKELTFSMIGRHDPSLYSALKRKKHEHGWPANFILPLTSDANDKKLEEGVPPSLREIADASPPHVREMIRFYELARSRKRNVQKTQR